MLIVMHQRPSKCAELQLQYISITEFNVVTTGVTNAIKFFSLVANIPCFLVIEIPVLLKT